MLQQTAKEKNIKGKLSEIKKEIRLDAVQNGEYYCAGCGKSSTSLDVSHILSVGQFKKYELVRRNMQLLDREHHRVWESGTIQEQIELLCFVDNLLFIQQVEPLQYQKFITRIEEALRVETDPERIKKLEEVLNEVAA